MSEPKFKIGDIVVFKSDFNPKNLGISDLELTELTQISGFKIVCVEEICGKYTYLTKDGWYLRENWIKLELKLSTPGNLRMLIIESIYMAKEITYNGKIYRVGDKVKVITENFYSYSGAKTLNPKSEYEITDIIVIENVQHEPMIQLLDHPGGYFYVQFSDHITPGLFISQFEPIINDFTYENPKTKIRKILIL